jgi:hypothetical protein
MIEPLLHEHSSSPVPQRLHTLLQNTAVDPAAMIYEWTRDAPALAPPLPHPDARPFERLEDFGRDQLQLRGFLTAKRILLVGRTGMYKSTLANKLLGRPTVERLFPGDRGPSLEFRRQSTPSSPQAQVPTLTILGK